MDWYDKIQEAAAFIRERSDLPVRTGLILGTGLDAVRTYVREAVTIPYAEIPHFRHSTVSGHTGSLILGYLDAAPVALMAGRLHYYEGYSMQEVTFPVRVLKALGVEQVFITNAAGATNPDFSAGDLVVLRDHINLHPENPLRGPHDPRLGDRFPDVSAAYDPELRQAALAYASTQAYRMHEGVYTGLQGPNLETPAEYGFIHHIGGDLVGMSTVPEVLVARHAGLKVFALSVISNVCWPPDRIRETSLDDVLRVVSENTPRAISVLRHLLKHFG